MTLSQSRAVKTPRWVATEAMNITELQHLVRVGYENAVDLAVLLGFHQGTVADDKNYVLGGCRLLWTDNMNTLLKAGLAVSTFGSYAPDGTDTWTFTDAAGEVFAVTIPVDTIVSFSNGGASARIDIVEVRVVRTSYDNGLRKFRDPGTGTVSETTVPTKYEFQLEVRVVEGVEGAGVAQATTPGWIKLAEVAVGAGVTLLSQANVKDVRDSATWTTNASVTLFPEFTQYDLADDAVQNRHIAALAVRAAEIDLGTDAGDVDADVLPLGTAVTSSPTGGTATSLANSSMVRAAIQEALDRLRDASGIANGSIANRHLASASVANANYCTASIDNAKLCNNAVYGAKVCADGICTEHINWGVGASQVDGADVPITDAYGKFTTDNVQAALNQLAGEAITMCGIKTFQCTVCFCTTTCFVGPMMRSQGIRATRCCWVLTPICDIFAGIDAAFPTVGAFYDAHGKVDGTEFFAVCRLSTTVIRLTQADVATTVYTLCCTCTANACLAVLW